MDLVHILIADDHPIVRLGVRQLLTENLPAVEVGEARDANETLALAQAQPWDLLILDLNLPDRSGLELMAELKAVAPGLPVLILTVHAETQYGLRLLKAGAAGYVTKAHTSDELIAAVRKIAAGGRYLSDTLAERIALTLDASADALPHERLSDREFQVMCLLAGGLSVAEIAAALTLHARTVGAFRRQILQKLHLKSTQEIAYYAIRNGLVDGPKATPPKVSEGGEPFRSVPGRAPR